jgi:hypothetical protein
MLLQAQRTPAPIAAPSPALKPLQAQRTLPPIAAPSLGLKQGLKPLRPSPAPSPAPTPRIPAGEVDMCNPGDYEGFSFPEIRELWKECCDNAKASKVPDPDCDKPQWW